MANTTSEPILVPIFEVMVINFAVVFLRSVHFYRDSGYFVIRKAPKIPGFG
jgi:hypothetical protein